jgi:hypothetical protein
MPIGSRFCARVPAFDNRGPGRPRFALRARCGSVRAPCCRASRAPWRYPIGASRAPWRYPIGTAFQGRCGWRALEASTGESATPPTFGLLGAGRGQILSRGQTPSRACGGLRYPHTDVTTQLASRARGSRVPPGSGRGLREFASAVPQSSSSAGAGRQWAFRVPVPRRACLR